MQQALLLMGRVYPMVGFRCNQIKNGGARSLSENSVVGPRASVFSAGKDGEAGDVCFIVDTASCGQAEKEPLEARSSSPTDS
jgi:hypothetical protein